MSPHRRVPYPSPILFRWRLDCACGARFEIPCEEVATLADRDRRLNQLFLAHLKPEELGAYVLVDQRPGHEGCWIMPEGAPAALETWDQRDGLYYAKLRDSAGLNLVIGEIRTAEGRVLRAE